MTLITIDVLGKDESDDDGSPIVMIAPKKQEKKQLNKLPMPPEMFPTPQLEIVK